MRRQALAYQPPGRKEPARVEIDQYGGVGRVQIEDAADALEAARQTRHGEVGVERDFVAKREQERTVTRGPDGHWVNLQGSQVLVGDMLDFSSIPVGYGTATSTIDVRVYMFWDVFDCTESHNIA